MSINADELDKWLARRWLGIVAFSFMTGAMFTLVIVLIVMLMQKAI